MKRFDIESNNQIIVDEDRFDTIRDVMMKMRRIQTGETITIRRVR